MSKRRRGGSPYSGRASSGGRVARERSQLVYRADEPCLIYRCPACRQDIVTAVIVPPGRQGTPPQPPEVVRCVATPGCAGYARTDLDGPRPVPDVAAAWEWYIPDTDMIAATRKQGGPLWDHVAKGGMLLRHRHTIRERRT